MLTRFRALLSIALRYGVVAALAFRVCGTASGQQTAPVVPVAGQVLVMSDLHFDPMADPRLVDALAAAEPGRWSDVLDGSGDRSLGRYGQDSNWMLLRSALSQMVETLPHPTFVLISGDFLAHRFRLKFNAAGTDHSDAAYRIFVQRTMQFLGQQLEQVFPGTPIIPALGNNDEICGDYELQPSGPFLADTLDILRRLVGGGRAPDFDRDWQSYGNCSARVGGVRVLSTNTNFFSIHYRNACGTSVGGDAGGDPGRATLAWLEAQLAAAREAGERVWLLYHIPPGIDGYATLRQGACPGNVIPMWDQAYAGDFSALLRRYADVIRVSFAGHTHMDDFRLVGNAERRFGFALISPAVSPIFGQNPAFRTVAYDAAGGILDQSTYDLTNLPAATASAGPSAEWRLEYTFTQQWSLPRIDLPSLDRLYSLITDVPAEAARWHMIFPVSSPVYWAPFSDSSEQLASAVRAFRCAAGNVVPSDYERCYCGDRN